MKNTAVLVDGGFYIKRLKTIVANRVRNPIEKDQVSPKFCADALEDIIKEHLKVSLRADKSNYSLYRTFYYDAPPFGGNSQNPISGSYVDFSKTPTYLFQSELHKQLIKKRKVAMRMGKLATNKTWVLSDQRKFKRLLRGDVASSDLCADDIHYSSSQKQVDVKLGLDISTLAYKKLVDQIVIIAGDSDFVPVTKVARREGIDIILDPMKNNISDDLLEHIDGLRDISAKILKNKRN